MMSIFDVHNKFIAYSAPIKPIKTLASEWGLIYSLGQQDNKLFTLMEKDIQTKLDLDRVIALLGKFPGSITTICLVTQKRICTRAES